MEQIPSERRAYESEEDKSQSWVVFPKSTEKQNS